MVSGVHTCIESEAFTAEPVIHKRDFVLTALKKPSDEMKPSVEYKNFILFVRKCGVVIGADVYNPKFRPNIVTYLCISLLFIYFGSVIATVWKLYNESPIKVVEAFATSSSAIQAFVKYYCCCFQVSSEISTTNEFIVEIYEKHEVITEVYNGVITKNVEYMKKIIKTVSTTYAIPSIFFVITPIAYNKLTGERPLIMQVHLPGIDLSTDQGYNLTLCVHAGMALLCLTGLSASDVLLTTFLLQPVLFLDIFQCKINELNELLETKDNATTERRRKNENRVSQLLKDIVSWHQLSLKVTGQINYMFSPIITTVVLSSALAALFTLFILIISSWPGGYPFLILCFYALYSYCWIGTRVQRCNDGFTDAIYDIKWYNMTTSQQRTVRFLLLRSQKPKTLMVANVIPLSVKTALSITKTMYSAFMMMVQLLT